MPRKPTGQVLERRRQRGRVYALRFRAYGERQYLTLGTSADGWTRQAAEEELANVLADVRRGIWRPPAPDPAPEPDSDPTFHEFASEWFAGKRRELAPRTAEVYEWRLTHHLLPFFRDHRLSQITVREVEAYKAEKLRESERLRARHDAQAKLPRAKRERLPRPLSAETINKTLVRLGQILEVGVEYGHLERNPAAGRRRRLKVSAPQRSYLDRADQIEVLLDAAGELDRGARRGDLRLRRALVAALLFAGLRIGELIALRWRDVDLASGRLTVGQAKTDAGVRAVDLVRALRDELAAQKAGRHPRPDELVFATSRGGPQNASNVRNRLMASAVELANENREDDGEAPLPRLTPHSLRRTFASLLYALGHDPSYVMDQMGLTDPRLALRIYAHAMRRGDDEKAHLRALVEGTEWEPSGTTTADGHPDAARHHVA